MLLLVTLSTSRHSQRKRFIGLDDRVRQVSVGVTTRYVYDGDGRVMGEYGTSATDVKAEYIWMEPEAANDNVWGGGDGIGGYAPLAISSAPAGGTASINWVHANHIGVPLLTTDASGNAVTPYGYTQIAFPGQLRTLPDLYYNRHRDYDPTTGRYTQADPIGLDGDANPYAYAGNNPLRYVDPEGLNPAALGRGAVIAGEVGGQGLIWLCRSNIALCMRTIGPPAIRVANACKALATSLGGGDRCDELNNVVQQAKMQVGRLGKCVAGMGRWALEQRRRAWLELAIARARRDEVCWDGGDYGHQKEQAMAWKHASDCASLLQ